MACEIDRTGKTGKLTVRSDKEEDDVQTGVSQGGSSILDLDYNTKFFVGGVLSKDVDTVSWLINLLVPISRININQ